LLNHVDEVISHFHRIIELSQVDGLHWHLGPYDPEDIKRRSGLAALVWLQDYAEEVHKNFTDFKDEFPLEIRPSLGNADPLAEHFIMLHANFWCIMTGKNIPRSKSGPFVRYVTAAWEDLEFPDPVDAHGCPIQDLEGWMGARVDSHRIFRSRG
jgi:hypothetical protein